MKSLAGGGTNCIGSDAGMRKILLCLQSFAKQYIREYLCIRYIADGSLPPRLSYQSVAAIAMTSIANDYSSSNAQIPTYMASLRCSPRQRQAIRDLK